MLQVKHWQRRWVVMEAQLSKEPTTQSTLVGAAKQKRILTFLKAVKVLNHPNMIRSNRNKLTTLTKLAANKAVNVAAFCEADQLQDFDDKKFALNLPVIGRTNYHQGGKGFWLCLTNQQVQKAIAQGAQYFQNYIDIETEYRLHIFKGKLLWAVEKGGERREPYGRCVH